MIAVFRADGQYTTDGDPVYDMKSTLITDVRGQKPAAKLDQSNEIR
jgi:replication-associated recombination protein RarA